jgi:hypothetical protein
MLDSPKTRGIKNIIGGTARLPLSKKLGSEKKEIYDISEIGSNGMLSNSIIIDNSRNSLPPVINNNKNNLTY